MLRAILLICSTLLLGGWTHGTTVGACWTQGSDGWTVLCSTPITSGTCSGSNSTANGTCFVAVSNGGSSLCTSWSTSAQAAAAPCDTINHGIGAARPNQSVDWIMLHRGETFVGQDFDGSGGSTGGFCGYGFSATQPFVITNYGPSGSRPIVEANPNSSFQSGTSNNAAALVSFGGGGCAGSGNFLAIIGIDFYNYTNDPTNGAYAHAASQISYGIFFQNQFSWLLIEDCKFRYFITGINFQLTGNPSPSGTVLIRRTAVTHSFVSSFVGIGLFINYTNNLVIQQSVFDHNGWDSTQTGQSSSVTVTAGSPGTVTWAGNTFVEGDSFHLTTTVGSLAASTSYYVHFTGSPGNTFEVKDPSNNIITITSSGSPTAVWDSPGYDWRIRGHNLYLAGPTPSNSSPCGQNPATQFMGPFVVDGSIMSNDTSGNQGRGGGTYNNNLFLDNPYVSAIGMPTTATTNLTNNVILEGVDLLFNTGYSQGFEGITNACYEGDLYNLGLFTASNNVVAHTTTPGAGGAFIFDSNYNGETLTNNISCAWTNPNQMAGTNSLTGNYFFAADCDHNSYPAPDLTIGGYYGSIGGSPATTQAFITAAANNNKEDGWNPNLTATAANTYIRAGFGR